MGCGRAHRMGLAGIFGTGKEICWIEAVAWSMPLDMRVVFVGTGEIGVPSYQALQESPEVDVVGVVTQPDRPAGRKLELMPSPVKRAALGHPQPIFQPEKINQTTSLEQLAYLKPDVLVVCAYGQILKPAVLQLPLRACLNLHASLLPAHRGASCIQGAILARDGSTGMTVMWMDEGLDTGDILLQQGFRIGRRDTAGMLHDRLALLAPSLLLKSLALIREGKAPRLPQDPDRVSYAPKLTKADGHIDWKQSQVQVDRQIRAMSPWPSAYNFIQDRDKPRLLKIFGTILSRRAKGAPGEILRVDKHGILVAAGEGGLLLREVQMEGRSRMSAAEFARGQKIQPGMVLA
jgi:methionyl-tRNA formyltransferase